MLRRSLLALVVVTTALAVGAEPSAAASPEYIDVYGHGWGHGRGLGQYGARGYADSFGWSADQILAHFYGNTQSATVDPNQAFRVLLCDQEGVTICSAGGGIPSVIVTSGAPFSVEGVTLAAGQALRLTRLADRFRLEQSPGGCNPTGPWAPVGGGTSLDRNQDIDSHVADPGDDKTKMLRVCTPKARYYRGVLDYTMDGVRPRLVNTLGLDGYLKGVVPAEMPSAWNPAAVQAQAVAARSYALADARFGLLADTCDTIQCQVYGGASSEAAASSAAIAATSGNVRVRNGAVISTEFSSSTGGWTAGGVFPAVEDLGDGVSGNPNHDWNPPRRITDDALEAAYGLGDFLSIEVTQRNGLGEDGGRVLQVRITGTANTVTVDGNAFRGTFGLKSDWFTPIAQEPPKELSWTLRATATAGAPTTVVRYGGPNDRAISCDWDGDGDDTLGVYASGTWYLRNDLSPGPPSISVAYGAAGYTPVCGDWDGDGDETIGVYTADGWWHLRNSVTPGPPDISFRYGYTGALPVVGDWGGDDRDGIGVYDAGSWSLRDTPSPGQPERSFSYGYGGALPVVGDWDGDEVDGVGVFDGGSWMLRETATPGQPNRWFDYGYRGPLPVTGRWSSGADGIGITAVS